MTAAVLNRADLALIGTAATASGLSNAIGVAASGGSGALRFLEVAVVNFQWHGLPAFLTPTDLIAIASASILVIRFAAWVVAPLWRMARRGKHGGT